MLDTTTAKGALGAGLFALLWVQWGLLAALFVLLATALGAAAAGTLSGELDLSRTVRELQDRS